MQKDRDLSFDAFRGVAIIAVVAIHAMTAFEWGPSETGIWSPLSLVTYYRQSLSLAVPVFIFISGYWAAAKPMESLSDYKVFLIKRLSRILIPYLFWSFVIFGYETVGTHHIDLRQIMFKLLTGRATTIYYFIMILAKLYIITPLLQALNRERYGAPLIFALGITTVLSTYIARLFFNYWVPLSSVYYSWVIFYEIGLLARGFDNNIFAAKKIQFFLLFAIFVCLLLAGLETSLISKYYAGYFAITPVKFSATLYSVCVIFAFLCIKKYLSHRPKFLAVLGY
ncbi:MAG: acyltransferase, partial [Phycisphaerae bacterium]|nr:acyltransferase [Phycisphaerae bacterium]